MLGDDWGPPLHATVPGPLHCVRGGPHLESYVTDGAQIVRGAQTVQIALCEGGGLHCVRGAG